MNISIIENNSFSYFSGPSSGCVFATLLISLALQKAIPQDLAMTGTISSEGKIGPIGGIYKKVKAAFEAGLKTVIIQKVRS